MRSGGRSRPEARVAAISWPIPCCTRPTSRASGAVRACSATIAECVWPTRRVESKAGPAMCRAWPASMVERRTASPTTTARFARTRPSSTEPVTSIEPGLDSSPLDARTSPVWTSDAVTVTTPSARRAWPSRVATMRPSDSTMAPSPTRSSAGRGSPTPIRRPVTVMPSTPGRAAATRASRAPARTKRSVPRASTACSCTDASCAHAGATPRATGSLTPPCSRRSTASSSTPHTTPWSARAPYRSSSDGSGQGMRSATRRRRVTVVVRRLVLEPVAGAGHALDGHRREQLVGRHLDAHLEARPVVGQVHGHLGR